jgi:hypothetical protein
MSKGRSKNSTPPVQEVTSTTTNLPAYAEPYFRQTLERGLYETARPYEAYAGQRMMDFTGQEQAAMQGMTQMAQSGSPLQFQQASDIAAGVGYQPLGRGFDVASQYAAPDIQTGFTPGTVADPETLQSYMDPYQQMVTDIEKREAARQSDIMGSQIGQQAAQTGGMGGYREAIMQAERERNLGQQLGDIQAKGSQRAFGQAQQAFEADRAARLQAARMGMSAQEIEDRARQTQARLGLQGLGEDRATEAQRLQASQLLGGLGDQSQRQAYERLSNLQAAGEMQRRLGQQSLDMGYQDFVRQQAFPKEQLSYLSNILRGLPIQPGTTTTSYGGPTPGQQALGGGISLLGLYKGLR